VTSTSLLTATSVEIVTLRIKPISSPTLSLPLPAFGSGERDRERARGVPFTKMVLVWDARNQVALRPFFGALFDQSLSPAISFIKSSLS
jgi:hypothetical protein